MTFIPLKITCRLEEFDSLIQLILNSYKNNQSDLEHYSTKYTDQYRMVLNKERKAIDELINPIKLINELKVITERIYTNQNILASEINLMEVNAKSTKELKIASSKIGLYNIRRANSCGDIETTIKSIKNVSKYLEPHLSSLESGGFSMVKFSSLSDLANSINTDYNKQIIMQNVLKEIVIDNHKKLNKYWDKILDICYAGRQVFKEKNIEKRSQFIIGTVLTQLRINNCRTAVAGHVEPRAKIEFKPLRVGRIKFARANITGDFEMKNILPGEYFVTKYAVGKPNVIKNVTVIHGEIVIENFSY